MTKTVKDIKNKEECCEDGSCEKELALLKESYEKLKVKYGLPSFREINDNFDVDICELNFDTPLRDVRKSMIAKFSGFMNLVELLLNPSNGQMLNMFMSRAIGQEEKNILDNLFDKLGEILISSLMLDLEYSEKSEAEFIKSNFKTWQEIRKDALKVMGKIKANWGKNSSKKEKSYFG